MGYSALLMMGLALSALGQQFTSAPVITDNLHVTYTATLFDRTSSSIRGTVTASSGADGVGLFFQVSFTGLPADVGPFRMTALSLIAYHVHVSPVPGNGNCTAAGSHLDPYNRGEQPPCDPSDPATCQIGDLSGQHGAATDPTFTDAYTEDSLSNNAQSIAFIGDKSIVIHAANGTRLNCGNFQLVSETETEIETGASSSRHVALTRATGTTGTTRATGTGSRVASTSTRTTTKPPSIRVVPTSVPKISPSNHATTTSIPARVVPASAPKTSTSTHATTSTTTRVVPSARVVPTSVPTRFTTTTRPATTHPRIDSSNPAVN